MRGFAALIKSWNDIPASNLLWWQHSSDHMKYRTPREVIQTQVWGKMSPKSDEMTTTMRHLSPTPAQHCPDVQTPQGPKSRLRSLWMIRWLTKNKLQSSGSCSNPRLRCGYFVTKPSHVNITCSTMHQKMHSNCEFPVTSHQHQQQI